VRRPVELKHASRLLNHGPTVLVSAAHAGRRNVMAAAWAMTLDFTPPKVTVVIDKATFTRRLVEASGHFVLSVPCKALADLTYTVGNCSGAEMLAPDKIERYGIGVLAGEAQEAPLIEGCVGWLECRVMPEPHNQAVYDLFIGEVVAASADERVFGNGRWHFSNEHDGLRTLHHVAGGHFVCAGDAIAGRMLP
jgi:flavin reductase (DIM6/NTAB) family NADH-FMN oxidoreductase RutF